VLIAALDSLPEDYRAIVQLRDVEGLSPQEVSQITGLSVAVVKTRTHRARLVLRKRLGAYLSDRPLSLSPPLPLCGDGRAGRHGPPPRSGRRISSARGISSVGSLVARVRLALPRKRELLRKIFAGFLNPAMLPAFTPVTNLG